MKKLLPLVTLVLLAGCSSMLSSVVKPPKISNESLQVSSANLQHVDLNLKLDVENPNGFELPLENLRAEVFVKDKTLLSKHWEKLPTLAAKGRTAVELPFQVAWTDLMSLGLNILQDAEIPYRIKGTLSVKGISVPFDETGSLKVKR